MSTHVNQQEGFTLIELLVAMTVFSFMLLIITVGFLNIVRMHNAAISSNLVQDNARTAMDELVRGVRDSSTLGAPISGAASPGMVLCLAKANGVEQVFYIGDSSGVQATSSSSVRKLYKADDCTLRNNKIAITNDYVRVESFSAEQRNSGTGVLKPQVDVSITVGSNNNTTDAAGAATTCQNNNLARQFCAVVTLNSGAVMR